MKNKKGMSGALGFAIAILIAVIIVFIMLKITGDKLSESGEQSQQLIAGSQDHDSDGLLNVYDRCPCHFGEKVDEGCPRSGGVVEYYDAAEEKKCQEDLVKSI